MGSRGEANFLRMPAFGVRLYDLLMRGANVDRQYAEIAAEIAARCPGDRLLEVGMGPGRVLALLHGLAPNVALHGLDVSDAMVRRCRQRLGPIPADLRVGSIRRTDYPDGAFDLVTCSGSLYLWDEPVACLDEVFRILRPGGLALLFESHRDVDREAVRAALDRVLAGERWLRRQLGRRFLLRQLDMAYTTDEINSIVAASRFAASAAVEPITLAGLPIMLRIEARRLG
jgi:ubiquinone/menaquinone biosynthesis C-methylase UbiE